MLINIKKLYGKKLAAKDGEIGHVKDLYFDDITWAVRYVVVDSGSWLEGRLVLLSPHSFGHVDPEREALPILLSRERVKNSPPIESHLPISRQYEQEFYRYYGWPEYWQGGQLWGMGAFPAVVPIPVPLPEDNTPRTANETHLQGTRSIEGYRVEAADGPVGEVADLMLEVSDWSIRDVVVEAGHWYSGKKVRVTTGKIDRISYEDSSVYVNLTRGDIQRAGADEVAVPADVPHGAVRIRE
jgi:hypothetical protein